MKREFLKQLAGCVPYARKTIDRRTGRFLAENGGWAVTHQDSIFPLALLFVEKGTSCHANPAILDLATRGGNALCDAQDDKGQFEFVKIDGSRWGKIYMPWTIYHWCEAFALLRDILDKRSVRRWERGLIRAYEGLAEQNERPINHNIPTWNGMSLVRGAQVFGREEWHAIGTRVIKHNVAHLHPHGYWPEGDGPTYGYNRVYIHAIGLYHHFTSDRSVLEPLKRAVEFQTTFIYPDGSAIADVDGRQRYHSEPNTTGWPGYALFPRGQRLIDIQWQHFRKQPGKLPTAHLASAFQHTPDEHHTQPLHVDKPRARVVFRKSSLIRRHGAWMLSVSGYGTPPESRAAINNQRWIMTRSNCLSVWHDKLGVIIGGGHSKSAPLFATFDVWDHGAQRLEPDKADFTSRNGEEIARLHYGPFICVLRLKPHGNKLDITFELPPETARRAQVRAGFTLMPKHGSALRWTATGKPRVDTTHTLDPRRAIGVSWSKGDGYSNRRVTGEGWLLHMPEESNLAYPVYPFNPYAIDDVSPPHDARMALGATFKNDRTRCFTLEVK